MKTNSLFIMGYIITAINMHCLFSNKIFKSFSKYFGRKKNSGKSDSATFFQFPIKHNSSAYYSAAVQSYAAAASILRIRWSFICPSSSSTDSM